MLSIFNTQPQNDAVPPHGASHTSLLAQSARGAGALWNVPTAAASPEFAAECGAQACVTSLHELQLWVQALQVQDLTEGVMAALLPEGDALRVQFLHASG